jgi:mannose-6-phosphate isomerase-like protein (cupin superfamily)
MAVEYKSGETDERPWGRWQVLDAGPGHAVKRITVNPGGRLSLQYHHHREEHWIVVAGTGTVTLNEETFEAGAGAVFTISTGVRHRIENRASDPLVFIEVQLGDDLREDDIVRLEDSYGRA